VNEDKLEIPKENEGPDVSNDANIGEDAAAGESPIASDEHSMPPMQRLEGKIIRLLSDDEIGDRHQRFVIELAGGRTVLVAHNIDVAPRVEGLFIGGHIVVYGELASNDLGGVMHWTHADPENDIPGGWIEFKNNRYA